MEAIYPPNGIIPFHGFSMYGKDKEKSSF